MNGLPRHTSRVPRTRPAGLYETRHPGGGATYLIPVTNLVESVNFQLRKVTKTRGHFPTDTSALKLLRLAARNISDRRGGDLGTGTQGWHQALNQFEIHFPGRLRIT